MHEKEQWPLAATPVVAVVVEHEQRADALVAAATAAENEQQAAVVSTKQWEAAIEVAQEEQWVTARETTSKEEPPVVIDVACPATSGKEVVVAPVVSESRNRTKYRKRIRFTAKTWDQLADFSQALSREFWENPRNWPDDPQDKAFKTVLRGCKRNASKEEVQQSLVDYWQNPRHWPRAIQDEIIDSICRKT